MLNDQQKEMLKRRAAKAHVAIHRPDTTKVVFPNGVVKEIFLNHAKIPFVVLKVRIAGQVRVVEFIAQNPGTPSPFAALARQGHKITWVRFDGKYQLPGERNSYGVIESPDGSMKIWTDDMHASARRLTAAGAA